MSIKKEDNNIENLMSLYDDYANESKEKKKIMMNTIEEDMKSGLFKVKSSSSFNKTQSTKICNDLKKMYVDCILSQI